MKMVKEFQGWYQVFENNKLVFELIKDDGSQFYRLYDEDKEVDCFRTVKEFRKIYLDRKGKG